MTYLERSYEDSLKEIVTLKYKLELAEKALKECNEHASSAMQKDFMYVDNWKSRMKWINEVSESALKSIQGEG